jgi:adenylate kinase
MVIIFIGPPGSGKGTQAHLLKEYLPNLIIVTVSSLLLEKSSDGSIFGNQINEKMDKGELIEDNVVNQVLTDKFNTLKGEDVLIDGYPRSLKQAEFLSKLIHEEESKMVFNFNVEKSILKERILKRSQLESRKDDSVFDKRFEIYQETYKEILNFVDLNFDLKNIEANKALESINTEIKGFLKGL